MGTEDFERKEFDIATAKNHGGLTIDTVIGNTIKHNSGLAYSPSGELMAYAAGCIVILYNVKRKKRVAVFRGLLPNAVTCLAFSGDGKYLAVGDRGHTPLVTVYNINPRQMKGVVSELRGHTHGVSCVAFSPNSRYLVSVGFQHDKTVTLWNFTRGIKIASSKHARKMFSVAWSPCSSYFVTCGIRSIRKWTVNTSNIGRVSIKGTSVTLGNSINGTFLDVCATGTTFVCVDVSGKICKFDKEERKVNKTCSLRRGTYAISSANGLLAFGMENGAVRLMKAYTMKHVKYLPKPHKLGREVVGTAAVASAADGESMYPDTICTKLSEDGCRLVCVYSDRSIYIWDIADKNKIAKKASFMGHSGCIWGVTAAEPLPALQVKKYSSGKEGTLIATCSSDNTVRVWTLDPRKMPSQNVNSKELVGIIHVGDPPKFDAMKVKPGDYKSNSIRAEATGEFFGGLKCISSNSTGDIAVGDSDGIVRVYSYDTAKQPVQAGDCAPFNAVVAHDAEVSAIKYYSRGDRQLMATCSKDRLLHVYDVNNNYLCPIRATESKTTDHQGKITAVQFVEGEDGSVTLVSSGADSTVGFWDVDVSPSHAILALYKEGSSSSSAHFHSKRKINEPLGMTVSDIAVEPAQPGAESSSLHRTQRRVFTAQGKVLIAYSMITGKATHRKKMGKDALSSSKFGKVCLDTSGALLAVTCDGGGEHKLNIYRTDSFERVAEVRGHSEAITGLLFAGGGGDNKSTDHVEHQRLVSVSGDGCIISWKLPESLVAIVRERREAAAPALPVSAAVSPCTKIPARITEGREQEDTEPRETQDNQQPKMAEQSAKITTEDEGVLDDQKPKVGKDTQVTGDERDRGEDGPDDDEDDEDYYEYTEEESLDGSSSSFIGSPAVARSRWAAGAARAFTLFSTVSPDEDDEEEEDEEETRLAPEQQREEQEQGRHSGHKEDCVLDEEDDLDDVEELPVDHSSIHHSEEEDEEEEEEEDEEEDYSEDDDQEMMEDDSTSKLAGTPPCTLNVSRRRGTKRKSLSGRDKEKEKNSEKEEEEGSSLVDARDTDSDMSALESPVVDVSSIDLFSPARRRLLGPNGRLSLSGRVLQRLADEEAVGASSAIMQYLSPQVMRTYASSGNTTMHDALSCSLPAGSLSPFLHGELGSMVPSHNHTILPRAQRANQISGSGNKERVVAVSARERPASDHTSYFEGCRDNSVPSIGGDTAVVLKYGVERHSGASRKRHCSSAPASPTGERERLSLYHNQAAEAEQRARQQLYYYYHQGAVGRRSKEEYEAADQEERKAQNGLPRPDRMYRAALSNLKKLFNLTVELYDELEDATTAAATAEGRQPPASESARKEHPEEEEEQQQKHTKTQKDGKENCINNSKDNKTNTAREIQNSTNAAQQFNETKAKAFAAQFHRVFDYIGKQMTIRTQQTPAATGVTATRQEVSCTDTEVLEKYSQQLLAMVQSKLACSDSSEYAGKDTKAV